MNLLAGDIGGTKTLLGIYKFTGSPELVFKKNYVSFLKKEIEENFCGSTGQVLEKFKA